EFQEDFPGIQIALIDARTDQIVARVVAGEADIGVGTFREDADSIARTVTSKGLCHEERGADALVAVFMIEDGEQDSIH
ncbi:MAG TPA: hypothetical protein VJR47_07505, partial [Stellaceae bacterium]|nr:hypothetical protein [Stellaceae bacterium]